MISMDSKLSEFFGHFANDVASDCCCLGLEPEDLAITLKFGKGELQVSVNWDDAYSREGSVSLPRLPKKVAHHEWLMYLTLAVETAYQVKHEPQMEAA